MNPDSPLYQGGIHLKREHEKDIPSASPTRRESSVNLHTQAAYNKVMDEIKETGTCYLAKELTSFDELDGRVAAGELSPYHPTIVNLRTYLFNIIGPGGFVPGLRTVVNTFMSDDAVLKRSALQTPQE